MSNRIAGPTTLTGQVTFTGTVGLPANCVTKSNIGATSANPIEAEKIEQQINRHYGQSGNAADATVPIHTAQASGTVEFIRAGSITAAAGDSTVTVDLKKNGVSVLTAVITLDSGNTARVVEAGTINTAAYNADDFFELVIDATAGTGTLPTGLYVEVGFREAAE